MLGLKEKIKKDGYVLNDSILKVDTFLNHQIDPKIMMQMGEEFAKRFKDANITKVLTVEASGIAIGMAVSHILGVQLVFARKKKSALMCEDSYAAEVYSFTKKEANVISVLKKFMPANENVLIVDDFLANGDAAAGLASIVEQAGSKVVGIGIAIEKSFQPGRKRLNNAGYRVESLARIKEFKNNEVIFVD